MNDVNNEFYKALLILSRGGVGRHNLYKFFIPTKVEDTIRELNLKCTPEELMKEWKTYKDKL